MHGIYRKRDLNESSQSSYEDINRVVVRYADNPNGSVGDIAGISNEAGNVVGLMPHPERASHDLLGSEDGNVLLTAMLKSADRSASF